MARIGRGTTPSPPLEVNEMTFSLGRRAKFSQSCAPALARRTLLARQFIGRRGVPEGPGVTNAWE
eukprot:8946876-Pyramimonas_sp.AAC.1